MTAREALDALLDATTSHARLLAYGQLLEIVDDLEVAVWDGLCSRAMPMNTFYAHLVTDATRRDAHTTENCRWAQTSDMPYTRYRTIGEA